jgi:Transglycosylase SLT domain
MAKQTTMSEYLVKIGFSVDEPSRRRFEDALKLSTVKTERFAKDMTLGFAAAGAAFGALATTVTAGGITMMNSLAKQDLGYQLLSRRMFMGVEATRKMQVALDTLGVSLQDVIFGPAELRERYKTLIEDQDRMLQNMGGFVNMETAMRRVRDVAFEFTRMGPELQMFGVALTEDVLNKLTGRPESLEERLKEFNTWFQSPEGFVRIADRISGVLVPAFGKLWDIGEKIFTKRNVDWVVNLVTKTGGKVEANIDFFSQWANQGTGAAFGWDKSKSVLNNLNDIANMASTGSPSGLSRSELIGKAAAAAKAHGANSQGIADFLALIEQESNFNPNAQNARTGAFGMGQVMPKNWPAGRQGGDPDAQLDVAAGIFFGNLNREHGDARKALNDYYGHGTPGPGEPTFDQYFQQWQGKYNKWSKDPLTNPTGTATYQPQAFHQTINVGGVHITQPGASQEQIERAVKDGIDKASREEATRYYAAVQGSYA